MKDYIKNELVCLRALEPIGSDRYEELTKAIQWVDSQKDGGEKETKCETKHNYAHTTIQWKDDYSEEEVVISLKPYNERIKDKLDYGIFFYCESEEDFERLKHYENGEDFIVIGCTLFTETL